MRKIFWALSLVLCACGNSRPPVDENTMAAVLADLHVAEARALQIPADSTLSSASLGRNLDSLAFFYQSVLAHHNLDTASFRAALDWYTTHPEALDSAYKKGIVLLEGKSAEE